jgi:hemoglobin
MQSNPFPGASSLYATLGGESGLRAFVQHLYHYMDRLPEVRTVRDLHGMPLAEAGERLFRFLSGWLGGPPLYHQTYGEPRLRRRHMHVAIGDAERDQWLLCAQKALDDMHWPAAARDELMQRLREMANHLRNQGPFNLGYGSAHPQGRSI